MERLSTLRPPWGDAILHAELADSHPDAVSNMMKTIETVRSNGHPIRNEAKYFEKCLHNAKITLAELPDRHNPLTGAALERSKQEQIAALKDYG